MQMPAIISSFLRLNPFFLLLFGLLLGGRSQAQTGTTLGEQFYISITPNSSNVNDYLFRLVLATPNDANISIRVPGTGFATTLFLTANSSIPLEIPVEAFPSGPEIIENIGIYVQADAEISVYAINEANKTSDATMVLPYASLGDEYMIHSYNVPPPLSNTTPQQFSILATEDSTYVDITFAASTIVQSAPSFSAGQSTTVMLMSGEQIIYHSRGDLSGTLVSARPASDGSCKKIAVFAGHFTTGVGDVGNDHLYNQLYPVLDWGKEFVALPFETRFTGDPVQILALENNTTLQIGASTVTLDRGEQHFMEVSQPTYISSDKPVSVIQLTKSRQVDSGIRGDEFADPFMMVLSPATQTINDIVFQVITDERNVRLDRHFVQMVSPSSNPQVFLNGDDISDRFQPVPGNPDFSHASFSLNPGLYTMSSPDGVVAHGYAFGDAEAIGYALGGDLGDFTVTIADSQMSGMPDDSFAVTVCENSELTLAVSSEIPALKEAYTQFAWDMGDGTVLFGDTIRYRYSAPGTYPVHMTASKGPNGCLNLFVDRLIEMIPQGIEGIDGPVSVCPDSQDIEYQALGVLPGYTYQWFVDGGDIDGSATGETVTIDWNIADPGARVRVLARSPEGCLSDTVNYPIVLNETLAPAVPRGPILLCIDDIEGVVYTTPRATGSTYLWDIEGGTIVSDDSTNTVTVNWSGPGLHRLWYIEEAMPSADLCRGFSPVLEVRVNEALAANPTITAVGCEGGNNGQIELSITGGQGPYDVTWSNGATGPSLGGLTTGTYEVTITDAINCQVVEEIFVPEPDELSGTVDVQNAVCAGQRGVAIARIQGGTRPYRYFWTPDNSSTDNRRGNLSGGNYSVRVLDANNCELNLNYQVEEPTAMVAEIFMEQACPGQTDGSLTVVVSGGRAPYTYNWVFNPNETSSTLENLTDGTYELTVVDAAGCQLPLTGVVTNFTPRIKFPNAFSPNGDGDNETFHVVYNCALDFRMVVYNRWGNVVFLSTDIDRGWNGEYEGQPAPEGTYTYDIQYGGVINGNAFTETVRGVFKLFR